MGRIVLLLGLGLLLSATAIAQEPVPPPGASVPTPVPVPASSSEVPIPPPEPAHYAFVPGAVVGGDNATINVGVELESLPSPQIRFRCEVVSKASMREGWARMTVTDIHGKRISEARLDLPVAPGINQFQFLWDADKVPLGVYTARFALMQSGTFEESHCEIAVSKLTEPFLSEWAERAAREAGELRNHLKAMGAGGRVAPYAAVRAEIAVDFAARARECLDLHDERRAFYYLNYVSDTVKAVGAQLALGNELPELSGPMPSPRLANLQIRDGAFYAEGWPVFLAGGHGTESLARDLPRLRSYGLNLAAFDLADRPFTSSLIGAPIPPAVKAALDAAADLNISVTCLLAPPAFVPSEGSRAMADLGAYPLETRDAIGRYLRESISSLRGQPMLNSVAMVQQPAFGFSGDAVRDGFRTHLQDIYPGVSILNRTWKTRFIDVDEVTIEWDPESKDYHTRPSFQYDWQVYHQWLGTDFLRWMTGEARGADPRVPIYIEQSEDVLAPGESKLGVNREAIAGLTDLTGVAVSNSPSDAVYAMDYPHASLVYTLLRSLAPGKPILNSTHLILSPTDPSGAGTGAYVHSALWEGAMSGLNGSAFWEWARSADGQGGMLDRPDALDAYVTAALDLNRLGDIVHAFQQAPAPVAILWSMPGRIYEDGVEYLASIKIAYEGLSFGGQQIRFITEEQIAREGLDGVQVLVIPNLAAMGDEMTDDEAFTAIAAFMQAGGVVIKTGNPIPFDARGRSRKNVLIPTHDTILVRGRESASSYLDALDAAYGMGALAPVPRAISDYGYPLEGVRTRYLEIKGRQYLYVLNLRKTPVQCRLYGPYQTGRDLIRGRMVEFPMELQPLDPMLIQLMPVDPAQYMPTAKVGEPPAAPERQARKTRVQGGAPRR